MLLSIRPNSFLGFLFDVSEIFFYVTGERFLSRYIVYEMLSKLQVHEVLRECRDEERKRENQKVAIVPIYDTREEPHQHGENQVVFDGS